MSANRQDDQDSPDLRLLAMLGTPVWIAGTDGRVRWSNLAAAAALGLPGGQPQPVDLFIPTLAASLTDATLPAERTVTFHWTGTGEAGDSGNIDIVCRIARPPFPVPAAAGGDVVPAAAGGDVVPAAAGGDVVPAAAGGDVVLLEAVRDMPARREVLRLTEHLVAMSSAYPDMRFELTRDGTILDFATARPSDLNIPAERFLVERIQDVLPEPAASLVVAAIDRIADGAPVTGADFTLPGPRGDRYFEARLVALDDGARIFCYARNITQRTMAIQALRASEARFRLLLENGIDLIFIVAADGAIRYASPSLGRILGRSADEVLDQRLPDLVHEEDAPVLRSALAGLWTAAAGERLDVRFRMRSDDRAWHSFEVVCASLAEDPAVGGIVVNAHDITGRLEAERDALRARDRLIDAIEGISQAFVLYDAEDRLVLCNERFGKLYAGVADILVPGTPFEDIMHKVVTSGLYDIPARRTENWLAARLSRHREPGTPLELKLADGRWVRVEERRTREGGTVGVRTDISNLKRREAELREARDEARAANRRKSDFIHHLSHELRTPLNAVLGFAQIIGDELMGPLGNDCYRGYAQQITSAGGYMLDLINNLLDLAKIEAGRMELAEHACDVREMVAVTVEMLRARAAESGVELTVDMDGDLPAVIGDVSLIRQMLNNLVGNAIKFSGRPDGQVRIHGERLANGALALDVTDNGAGLTAEQIPLALAAFGQVHDRAAVDERGSGLGLPLTRALIELHGGTLAMTSEPGHGTTVRLVFPASRVGCLMDGDGI